MRGFGGQVGILPGLSTEMRGFGGWGELLLAVNLFFVNLAG
jgi:hypothetical protein